ncbi:FAD-binding oxidoreductase [Mesorhizobium sp.]|uniref:NAD(P)/FAD-dependent oxidoreductase n=1 Tax=Mesorhizobium sp. TaxID=1871066 RepID=UPI0025D38F3E|nr:FAD-binding oxidoreductase [Mesorhizobium sp.]
MPAAANSKHIVVVGGGIIGCSTAYHLLKSGVKSVTLVDATEPGAATTSAGAGFVSHWSAGMIPAGEEGLRLQQYGLDFYRMLHELGTEIGYRPNGTLIMALTPQGREDFVLPVLNSPYAPKEMQDLNAKQIGAKMGGLIDPAKVHSGAYNPHGIQLDTKLALGVLVNEIKKLGGVVRSGTKVGRIENTGGKVTLHTDREAIEADGAVVAAGAWNNEVLASLDWHLPLLRVLATRVVTDDRGLPSTLPTVQCRELRLWLRETFGAIMWGTGSHYTPMHRLEESDIEPGQPHNRELMQSMVDFQMGKLQEVFPPLRGSKVANWSQGIPCYTPDVGLMVGHVPGHANIVVAGGDNETGVSHGPGLGRLASEILLDAPRFVDPARFRIDRYARDAFPSEEDVEASMPAWSARHGAKRFAAAAE